MQVCKRSINARNWKHLNLWCTCVWTFTLFLEWLRSKIWASPNQVKYLDDIITIRLAQYHLIKFSSQNWPKNQVHNLPTSQIRKACNTSLTIFIVPAIHSVTPGYNGGLAVILHGTGSILNPKYANKLAQPGPVHENPNALGKILNCAPKHTNDSYDQDPAILKASSELESRATWS